MAMYTVKEVTSRRDLKRFITFVDDLYKGCDMFVPPLHKGQERDLMHSPSLQYCTRKMWIAEDADGKVVGRICAMINPRYNEKYDKRRVRFGWFDLINDIEVAQLLMGTAESWAKENGMEEIHGPLFYNTLGRQGMLIEGFDKLPPFSCLYNYPYYVELVEQLGFEKECDWIQYMMPADQGVDDRLKAIADRMMQRYNVRVADFDKLKKDKDTVKKFFKMYNASFDGIVHNFIPFTDAEIEEECRQIMGQLDSKLCCVLMDEDDEVAAFGIATPCLSRAMQKAKGRMFPFGWYHLLKALKAKRMTDFDLLLIAVRPDYQNKGVNALFFYDQIPYFQKYGIKYTETTAILEENSKNQANFAYFETKQHKRRRAYIKQL